VRIYRPFTNVYLPASLARLAMPKAAAAVMAAGAAVAVAAVAAVVQLKALPQPTADEPV
jgi:hypothetical protein